MAHIRVILGALSGSRVDGIVLPRGKDTVEFPDDHYFVVDALAKGYIEIVDPTTPIGNEVEATLMTTEGVTESPTVARRGPGRPPKIKTEE